MEEEDEDKDIDEVAAGPSSLRLDAEVPPSEVAERTPLLKSDARSRSRSRRRRMSIGPHGDATVTQAVLMACLPLYVFSPNAEVYS